MNIEKIVNDEFWLSYASDLVTQSITSRNEGAAKLEKMVIWFWGIYTTAFTIGTSINLINAPFWILVLLASPIVLLIISGKNGQIDHLSPD